jgi:nitric oxide reductase activation protein
VTALEQVEESLALFAEGLAGRYIHIKSAGEQAGERSDPLRSGQSTEAIYLPEELPGAERGAYLVLVLQQLGYRECGTFGFRYGAWCEHAGREPPPQKPHVQPDRDSDFTRLFSTFANPAVARRLFLLLEELRINAHVRRAYPGAARYLDQWQALLLSEQVSSDAPFDRLTACVNGDRDACPEISDDLVALESASADVFTTADLLVALYPHFHHDRDLVLDAINAEVSGTEWMQREARLEDWKDDLEEKARQLLAVEMLQAEDALLRDGDELEGETRDTSQTLYSMKNERDNLARRVEMERAALRYAVGIPKSHTRSFRYDEWNWLERRYLKRYCRLYEERIQPETGTDVEALRKVIREWRAQVKSQLAQLKPMGLQRVFRVHDGDELDMNAVLNARQDIRAGISPDERTYSRRDRVQRDICAAFLVDLSASTDDPINPPEPVPHDPDEDIPNLRDPYYEPRDSEPEEEPRKIIHVQREAMLVMASALDVLGDSFGIYGFSGYGHDCVEYFVAKEPDEALNLRVLNNIAAMQPKRSTRMGPAIRHTVTKLISAGQSMKILIVLSDGFPQDCDYGPIRGDHEYGLQDTARALAEAANKGIETFCITVDRSGHDYLKRMCPDARYLVIDEMEDLPAALTKVYTTLTLR